MTTEGAKHDRLLESLNARVVGQTGRGCAALESEPLLIAVVASRLGHDPALHQTACRFLTRSLLDCRQRCASLVVAVGSAIEPWATRAAELYGVPLVRLSTDPREAGADIIVKGDAVSRDAAVIALADRVDAVYVRRGGTIATSLLARLAARRDASTRVAVTLDPKCAAARLIDAGAIGWVYSSTSGDSAPIDRVGVSEQDDTWTRTDGEWLVHCTRSRRGTWPDETLRQYRDSMLLGDERAVRRDSLDSLCRIVRGGRLVAGAVASSTEHAVVCFSAVPLAELLERRCFRPHLGRWDYEPYGIAIRRARAAQLGIQPVIYGEPESRATLSKSDQFRFHPRGKTYDWSWEREWRSSTSVDLNRLDPSDVRVFATDSASSRSRLDGCPWRVTYWSFKA